MRTSLKWCSLGLAIIFLLFVISPASAEKWSRRYIKKLPDSAFAVIETTKEGKKIRHLPHHNHKGELDIPHLKSALARIHQVKWIDPANFAIAKDHLEQHYRVLNQEEIQRRVLKTEGGGKN